MNLGSIFQKITKFTKDEIAMIKKHQTERLCSFWIFHPEKSGQVVS